MATPLTNEYPTLTLVPPSAAAPVFKDEESSRKRLDIRTVASHTNRLAQLVLLPHTFRGYRQLAVRWLDRYHNHYPQLIADADQAVREAAGDLSTAGRLKADADRYRAEYRQHRKSFLGKTAAAAGAVAGGVGFGVVTGSLWLDLAAGIGALGLGAFHGWDRKPGAEPIGSHTGLGDALTAKVGDGAQLTDTLIDQAFRDAGIIKGEQAVVFKSPVTLDGRAWAVLLELTGGVTVTDVQKKAGALASALGIPRHQMDIRHEGREDRLSLWVSMVDPFAKAVPNPLVGTSGRVNAWRDGLPLGFDKRGALIRATINDYSLLAAGATRSGKGMAIANILVGAMLDPRVRIRLFDGKGTGEYVGMAPALDTFVRRNPGRLLEFLRALADELERRTELLVDLGVSKASEELLEQLGGIELVIVDELATYTVKGGLNGQHAEEITELLAQIAAVGAAAGIVLVLATQTPKVEVINSRLRGNCSGRWAMRTESATASNVILGDGAAGDGYDSSKIPNSKSTRGRGWLTTPDTGFVEARSLFVDVENGDLRKAAAAGLELRAAAGRLPGKYPDPIEDALYEQTGVSMVAGGPTGKGKVIKGAPQLPEVITLARSAFTDAGDPDRLTSAEIYKYAAARSAEWEPGDDEEIEKARDRFLKALRDAATEIAPNVDMKARQWSGGRGYYLETIKEIAGEARA